MLAIGLVSLKSYACTRTFNYYAALGVEVNYGRFLLYIGTEVSHMGAFRHIVAIEAGSFGLIVDGEDATVEFLVITVELLGHFLVEEPSFGRPRVRMLVFSPVELPPGVGTQLVKAAVERIVEYKRACSLSVFKFNQMSFQHVTFLVPKLGIEQLAEVGQLTCITSADVCLEVECIACKVAGIVHVYKHFFLWNVPAKEV